MSKKHQFINSTVQILKHNKDGSFRTQNDRRVSLLKSINDIYAMGYQLDHVKYIRQRHIKMLVNNWKKQGLSPGAMKNRLSHLRWLMDKIDKPLIIPKNDNLGIPKRVYVSNIDKSRDLTASDLAAVNDIFMQLSLRGQRLFGLRVEESLKIQPFVADGGALLYIKKSWAKGGRERIIPILTVEQRAWLDECKAAINSKSDSLIPINMSYKQYRTQFNKRSQEAGINKRHGLRHMYAQERYRELAGFDCVVQGGPDRKNMSLEQRQIDRIARLQVSNELGHSRVANITSQYLGTISGVL
jgi:integrase